MANVSMSMTKAELLALRDLADTDHNGNQSEALRRCLMRNPKYAA